MLRDRQRRGAHNTPRIRMGVSIPQQALAETIVMPLGGHLAPTRHAFIGTPHIVGARILSNPH